MPIEAGEAPGLAEAITPEGWLRTTPALWRDRGGLDGFFVARFVTLDAR
jgi:16S rRNA (cytosine967-C5)-methyltransferase